MAIDVHHHFYPSLRDNEGRAWSVEMTIDELERNDIAAAVCGLPPIRGDNGWGRAREQNEWGTRLCLDHPGRLGLFASLPLGDVDRCLAEIAHCCDVLRVDGFGLPTSHGDVWLSDDLFAPVFAELNRRRAVVFVHPYPTSRCGELSRAYGGDLVSPPWLEFPANTARVILGLLARGVARRCPDIRFIFSHGGGVMPLLLGRIAGFEGWSTVGSERLEAAFPGGIHAAFARFHFDCAQAYAPEAIALMRRLVPASQLLFGSDYPYFPVDHSVAEFAGLALPPEEMQALRHGNAAALFPRFRLT